jgi:hypothetical protein
MARVEGAKGMVWHSNLAVAIIGGKIVVMGLAGYVEGMCRGLICIYFHNSNLEVLCKIAKTHQRSQSVTRNSNLGLRE